MPETTQPPDRLASCECGALCLHVTAAPVHGCTCAPCQRGNGSVMKLSAWFPEDAVRVDGALTTLFCAGTDDAAVTTCFCPTCGGGRFFRTEYDLRGTIGIVLGAFADPAFPAPDHIHWWPDRPHWSGMPLGPTLLEGN
ncbi:MAG: GFA family protein [Tabrizicola sp.]|uniref:GFA family protein n=1 Tax=Tabrizicola sp. TaxID=2005166 RepID=UPI002AB9C53A|nr:GFA family protein [Tabrizicola sp.]MDZ4087286.1 GFA family protein [Tabrizicola sp.]